MGYRLWLDDIRKPPWGYDLWAKTYEECVAFLEKYSDIEHVSLDHDLHPEHYETGDNVAFGIDRTKFQAKTGYAVIEWMHEHNVWPPDISVHTLSERGGFDMMAKLTLLAPAGVVFRRVWPGNA